MNSVFDNAMDPVKVESVSATEDKLKQVRALKAQGKTWAEVATILGITKQGAHYHGRPRPGEHICPTCCQKLKRAK